MQQYYDEPRPIYERMDEGFRYAKLGNSRAMAEEMIAPPETVVKGRKAERGLFKRNQLEPGEWEKYQDFKAFTEAYGESDPVFFPFSIQIDTNSTLPLDKQSLANLAIRLAQMKLLDPQAVLETLQFPKWQEIIERMKQEAGMAPPGGGVNVGPNENAPQGTTGPTGAGPTGP
jgi:hypothetical protein